MARRVTTDLHDLERRFTHARMSWRFIIFVLLFLPIYVALNTIPGLPHFDPYEQHGPKFEILNLIMSAEQVLSNPIIFMALFAEMLADRVAIREILKAVHALLNRLDEIKEPLEE